MNIVSESRIDAEKLYAAEQGKSCQFEYAAVADESSAEHRADEIFERFGGKVITPSLALELAVGFGGDPASVADDGADRMIIVETLRCMLEIIGAAKSPKLQVVCLQVAMGFRDSNKTSMRGIAAQWGVTPAAISKTVKQLRATFELPVNSFNKSAAATAGYKLTNGRTKIKS